MSGCLELSRGARRSIAEINVVPYVDVMLVLLIIFMVTAPLMSQGVQVELPEASANPLPVDTKVPLPIIVSVVHTGAVYLNIAASPGKALSLNQLKVEVAAALQRHPKRLVVVKADQKANYNTVLQAMVSLQQAGVDSVGLETVQAASS